MRIYVPSDILPQIVDGIIRLARHGACAHKELPSSLTIWLTSEEEGKERIDFLLMKDPTEVFFYEALYGIELDGVPRDLRVYP